MRVFWRSAARSRRALPRCAGRFNHIERGYRCLLLPEEDCAAFAVRAINNAEREILVGAYGLTTGSGIVEALVRAKERGVDVRLIADKTTPCRRESGIEPLAAAGVPVWIYARARIATMVIDSAVTLTGSMN
jgi:phosphatidylserine/phosphatidylglycerophosphate/cardiolipin synthase-like enzyme